MRRIINRPFDSMGCACIELRAGHLRWFCTFAQNSWVSISSRRTKFRADCSRWLRALAWLGWLPALGVSLWGQKCNDVANTCNPFSDAWTIERWVNTVLLFKFWPAACVYGVFIGWITADKRLICYARENIRVWVTHRLSVALSCPGLYLSSPLSLL